MKHVEYVYTSGMTESEVDERLRDGHHGVLGLADDSDAYAVPLSYHYDGDQFLLRVSGHDGAAEKRRYIETTDVASFVCFDASSASSWSIQIRGSIEPWSSDVDSATVNEWFPPFRLFDEAVEEVNFDIYELRMEHVAGRQTVD